MIVVESVWDNLRWLEGTNQRVLCFEIGTITSSLGFTQKYHLRNVRKSHNLETQQHVNYL